MVKSKINSTILDSGLRGSGAKRRKPPNLTSHLTTWPGIIPAQEQSKNNDVPPPKADICIASYRPPPKQPMPPPYEYKLTSGDINCIIDDILSKVYLTARNEGILVKSHLPVSPEKKTKSNNPFKDDFASIIEDRKNKEPPTKSNLWVDKYSPNELKSLIGNSKSVQDISKWLDNIHSGNDTKRACMISGPPGIGKTSTAKLLLNKFNYDVMEFNASSDRSKVFISNKLKELTQSKTFYKVISKASSLGCAPGEPDDKVQKAIIMDEVDGMSSGDDGGVTELINFVKAINKKNSDIKTILICVCNNRSKINITQLAKECIDVRFYKPSRDNMFQRANYLLGKEKIRIPVMNLYKIVDVCDGDIRKLINTLQFITVPSSHTNTTKGVSLSNSLIKQSFSDKKSTIFDAYNALTCSSGSSKVNIIDKEEYALFDSHMSSMLIHENFIDYNISLDDMATLTDSLSCGDINMKEPYYSWNSVIKPSSLINGDNKKIRFPSYLGKMSSVSSKLKIMQTVMNKFNCPITSKGNYISDIRILINNLSACKIKDKTVFNNYVNIFHKMNITTEDLDSINKCTCLSKSASYMKIKIALEKLYV